MIYLYQNYIKLWIIGAHKESIRHIHYIDIYPRIIVTTSHDLRIKIFIKENLNKLQIEQSLYL